MLYLVGFIITVWLIIKLSKGFFNLVVLIANNINISLFTISLVLFTFSIYEVFLVDYKLLLFSLTILLTYTNFIHGIVKRKKQKEELK